MSKSILIAVTAGVAAGYLVVPDFLVDYTGPLITAGLCFLLFFVGMDIGRQGSLLKDMKEMGFKVLIIPLSIILGTFAGGLVSGLVLPMTVQDTLAVSAGFGWYSMAPAILTEDYSVQVGAVSFLHNVLREVTGLVLIPIVAKRVGYLETVSLPGAAAMDVCMPVVERATSSTVAVYSFVSGLVITIAVPVLVRLIISF